MAHHDEHASGLEQIAAELSAPDSRATAAVQPDVLRSALLLAHAKLRSQLRRIESSALALGERCIARDEAFEADASAPQRSLRSELRSLIRMLAAHASTVARVFANLLARSGALRESRLRHFHSEQASQVRLLHAYAGAIDEVEAQPSAIAVISAQLAIMVRKNLECEEEAFSALAPLVR